MRHVAAMFIIFACLMLIRAMLLAIVSMLYDDAAPVLIRMPL